MSNGTNNFRSWRPDNPLDLINPMFPRVPPFGETLNAWAGQDDLWRQFQERVTIGPPGGLTRTPVPTHSSMQIIIMRPNTNLRARQSIPESPPWPTDQWTQPEESVLSSHEQNKDMKNLRKEIYNPSPKRLIQRMSLYYRENNRNSSEKKQDFDDDDDGKRCAVCLDDFETKEVVILTPCDHMFHENCIVPWVKSNVQCPVCRSRISDPRVR